jgi:hypothetical protein
MMPQIPPKTSITHNPDEKIWFVSGVFGTLSPAEGRMQWYRGSWKPEADQLGQIKATELDFEFVADMRMSPAIFKDVMLWMKNHVDEYEKTFGEIKMQPTGDTKPAPDKTPYG